MEREIETDTLSIKILAHVSSRVPGNIVDDLRLTEISEGDEAEAVAYVAGLKRIYVGLPLSHWEAGELDQ
jgi:hypothetical protein